MAPSEYKVEGPQHMIRPGFLAATLATALLVQTSATQAQLSYEQAVAYCKSMGEMAKTVMENRQKGITQAEQLQSLDSMENEHYKQLMAKLIGSAYERATQTDEDSQSRAIDNFRNEYEQACYKLYLN